MFVIGCTTSHTTKPETNIVAQTNNQMEKLQEEFETFAAKTPLPPFIIYRYDDRVEVIVETKSDYSKVISHSESFLKTRPNIQIRIDKFPQFSGG